MTQYMIHCYKFFMPAITQVPCRSHYYSKHTVLILMTVEGLSAVECWQYVCGYSLQELELLTFQKKQQNVSSCSFWVLHTFLPVLSMGSALHVGISPTILGTSKWAAFISWSPSLIRWIKCGQFAVVVFLCVYIYISRQGIPRDWPCWSPFRACCPVQFESILQATDWLDRKQAKLGTDVSLLTQVFVCCASRWPRQPLNLPRLGTAWPC